MDDHIRAAAQFMQVNEQSLQGRYILLHAIRQCLDVQSNDVSLSDGLG